MLERLPEPLQSFAEVAGSLAAALQVADELLARFRADFKAGRILPNTLEAIRVELTYHSNALEGSTLTLRDTQLVVEGREPNTGKSLREIYEARNLDRALRTIERAAVATAITEQNLLDVHAQVLADIDVANAGRYRADRVLITGTRFVPPGCHKFPVLILALLEHVQRPGVHAIVQAAELHYNLAAVHPFSDGNGRTARLMMNDFLLRRGYPLTIIPVEHRAEYLAALVEANDGRVLPLAAFIVQCVDDSIRMAIG